ncbi:MAG: PEP/pyruvate-binding domain-containing protein [Candidatus Sulfopaludibacter sp.]|nr:PEP/pyruvate-binding domain-containing protein [Candidatus Sulfopaludibacter sp.]
MILTWDEAAAAGSPVCGGKGYNLARLARYGFRVPDGGVLAAGAYLLAMQDAALADAIRHQAPTSLPEPVRAALGRFLEEHHLQGAALAVRSSATMEDSGEASFAGIHESVLQVRGLAEVERAVLACYGSLWSARARAYREKLGVADDAVACAVVICRMVASDGSPEPVCAGVAFSADPATGRRDLIVIDAAPGLGEAVVKGHASPERYTFRNVQGDLVPLEQAKATPLLSESQARELAWTVRRIQWALGDGQIAQDVEWAHDGEQLWILQARPVVRLPRIVPLGLRGLPRYWSNANIQDSSPGVVCELSWSEIYDAVEPIVFASARASGYEVPNGVELVHRFHGRGYLDLSLIQWIFFDAFGLEPEVTARSLGGYQPLIPRPPGDPLKGPEGTLRRRRALKLSRCLWRFEKKNAAGFQRHIADMRALAAESLAGTSTAELKDALDRISAAHRKVALTFGLASSAAGRWAIPLESLLRLSFGRRAVAVLGALSSGSGEVTSAEQGYRIGELARIARQDAGALQWLHSTGAEHSLDQLPAGSPFRRGLEQFLEEFGHRAIYEGDYRNPRGAEDPAPLLHQIRNHLALGGEIDARAAARTRRLETEKEVRRKSFALWPVIRWLAAGLRRSWAIRESGKSALIAAMFPERRIALEVGRRLVAAGHLDQPDQVFDLSAGDLRSWLEGWWDGSGARALWQDRQQRREAWMGVEAPAVIAWEEAAPAPVSAPAPALEGDTWRGIAASPGSFTGVARIVLHPGDGERLAHGEILVAPSLDPGWTALFPRAAAIIVENGGYLSHGAIIAREFGLPAVLNLPGLLRLVRDGERLHVDGENGTVSRVL